LSTLLRTCAAGSVVWPAGNGGQDADKDLGNMAEGRTIFMPPTLPRDATWGHASENFEKVVRNVEVRGLEFPPWPQRSIHLAIDRK
jgi:hypothetical protein